LYHIWRWRSTIAISTYVHNLHFSNLPAKCHKKTAKAKNQPTLNAKFANSAERNKQVLHIKWKPAEKLSVSSEHREKVYFPALLSDHWRIYWGEGVLGLLTNSVTLFNSCQHSQILGSQSAIFFRTLLHSSTFSCNTKLDHFLSSMKTGLNFDHFNSFILIYRNSR